MFSPGKLVSQVIEFSTNSRLAQKMPDIIDFDTGTIISGEKKHLSSPERKSWHLHWGCQRQGEAKSC
jgi:altronate dehydratase